MRSAGLLLNIQIFLVALAIAIFTLGFTYFTLFVSLLIVTTSYPKFVVPRNTLLFYIIVFMSGSLIALIMVLFNTFPDSEVKAVFLRNRLFLIRILFALAVCLFLMRLTWERVLYLLFIIVIIQVITGVYELLFTDTTRISMLTSEPSAAAMYYVLLAPLMIGYYKINKSARIWIVLYLIMGLFIQSKALFLVIPILILYLVFKSDNKNLKIAVWGVLIVSVLSIPFLLGIKEVDRLVYFIDILKEQGIEGLTEQNKIWSTFTLRFSSVLTSIQLLFENPWGIGFGSFHWMYIDKMTSNTIQSTLTGVEIRGILNGELYATPKSLFLEYAISCGIFFLLPVFVLAKRILSKAIPSTIKVAFIGVILISLIVELSPFMTFLGVLMILSHKIKKENYLVLP
ncbi:hypothetical protein [Muriicola soli]|uniref:Oligosaccharide repeat unit polymerase n=1 Tax=Muriicola soli TaxID=2507538 RepID=A0A411ECD8_9FLAO|nr:hypothetical protein [Muriicola soli]QBA65401.1 hypothetical protein EQY75_13190 [Muriicola soli]